MRRAKIAGTGYQSGPPGRVRHLVLAGFAALSAITYFDRACIAQAAKPIASELALSDWQMSWVFSAFTLAYALFEIPAGRLGDVWGPRRVLIRVVLWWSAFTCLTGVSWSFASLLLVRFAFGAGEAGAFPNIARALTGWYPPEQRGRVQGVIWTTSRVGGALAPGITGLLIEWLDWRSAFWIFGSLGVAWVVPFALWYRDNPEEMPAVGAAERTWLRSWRSTVADAGASHALPLRALLRNRSVWGLSLSAFWSAFGWFFFVTWLPSYLERERGLSLKSASWIAGAPLFLGIFGCAAGGWISDHLVVRLGGTQWARRIVGGLGQAAAGSCFLLGVRAHDTTTAILLMGMAGFCNDLTLSSLWAANMDVGERHAGTVSGVVSAASAAGAFLSPLLLGQLLTRNWGWTTALYLAGTGFFWSALCWLMVDPTRTLAATAKPAPGPDLIDEI